MPSTSTCTALRQDDQGPLGHAPRAAHEGKHACLYVVYRVPAARPAPRVLPRGPFVLQSAFAELTQECILLELVSQKKQLAALAQRQAEADEAREAAAAKATAQAQAERVAAFAQSASLASSSKKRAASPSQDERAPQRRVNERSHDDHLPAFWLPSLAPTYESSDASATPAADRPSTTMCLGVGTTPHKLTAKMLVDVHFSERTVDGTEQVYCPCCRKECTRLAKTSGTSYET